MKKSTKNTVSVSYQQQIEDAYETVPRAYTIEVCSVLLLIFSILTALWRLFFGFDISGAIFSLVGGYVLHCILRGIAIQIRYQAAQCKYQELIFRQLSIIHKTTTPPSSGTFHPDVPFETTK